MKEIRSGAMWVSKGRFAQSEAIALCGANNINVVNEDERFNKPDALLSNANVHWCGQQIQQGWVIGETRTKKE